MNSVNRVILLARLGKNPESRSLDGGNTVTNFTVATSDSYKDKEGNLKTSIQWHNIVTWGKTAEVAAKYLHKGDPVYLEGKITNRSYEKDGITKYVTEVVVNNLTLLGGNNNNNSNGNGQDKKEPGGVENSTSDLPF